MNFKIEKVLERDIDLLMINKFINNNEVLNYFLNKIELNDYELIEVEHSHMDTELGESDITLVVEKNHYKVGILIEDKIDAIAMDMQPERYAERGEKGINDGLYNEYKIIIIAPKKYLESNTQAKKYPNQISYEELSELMKDDIYANSLLNKAIEEKESGYTVIENEMVTNFWERYYEFIRTYYPSIKIHEIYGARGSRAVWPELITDYPQVKIMHKSDRGQMDLTFSGMANYVDIFNKYTESVLTSDTKVLKTNKSLAIRLDVPIIDFKQDFDSYITEMHKCMQSALRLYEILSKINVLMMYEEINKQ